MRTQQKHVITGGPSVGKTKTLEALAARGYETVRETARDIIEIQQEVEKHGATTGDYAILPWSDNFGFQYLVLDTLLRRERQATGEHVFCDRGAFDGIAYCRVFGNDVPAPLLNVAKHRRYEKVFLLDELPTYVTDAQRRESPELAKRIHEAIGDAYRELGYEVIRVPVSSPSQRADYIIERIGGGRTLRNDYIVQQQQDTAA